jgi:glyoxylase-like metal-dependent hydrolase (beta-lactamase superfamily II)
LIFYEGEGPIEFGELPVVHTPGHCPGGVCLAISKQGDSSPPHLFALLPVRSAARLPGGDYETLLRAITETLFAFPDESIVYSGHGPETTIGREKKTNPFVLEYLASRA